MASTHQVPRQQDTVAGRALDAGQIVRLHHAANLAWHREEPLPEPLSEPPDCLLTLTLAQHRENFDLWHQEDEARDPQSSDAAIARVKHAIDAINQRRNDLVEELDRYLYEQARQNEAAPLDSETPGLIIDRLSILALKIFHTEEQTRRSDASEAHRSRNRERLALLTAQHSDLTGCLQQLWADIIAGRRRFKLYRQMKMYNDPELNPVLYTRAKCLP